MLRIGHCSDLHIDERNRLDDTVAVLDALLRQTREAEIDLLIISGDHFERRSTPAERNVLARFLREAATVSAVACIKGNHDQGGDLDIFSKLDTDHPVHVFDRPTAAPGSAVTVFSHRNGGHAIAILALPWFDRAHLVAGLDATVDAEQSRQITIAAARDLLVCIRAEADRARSTGAVPILGAHIMVGGSETSTGQTLIGTSVELAPGDLLDVGAAYVALGHIHLSQEWFGGRVAYSGSPRPCNFGESDRKGWRLVTIDDAGEFVSSEFREVGARRMVLVEADWTGQGRCGHIPEHEDVAGSIVRFRYRILAQDLHRVDDNGLHLYFQDRGAHEVKVEAVVEADTRVRSAEIAHVTSTADKVDAFWRAKGIEVDDPTRARVFGNLSDLEEVVCA